MWVGWGAGALGAHGKGLKRAPVWRECVWMVCGYVGVWGEWMGVWVCGCVGIWVCGVSVCGWVCGYVGEMREWARLELMGGMCAAPVCACVCEHAHARACV